jgi:hypothetical protein
MPAGPREIEQRSERTLNAWETLAPEKSFGGMTLAQFRVVVQATRDARRRIDDLEAQLRQAMADREAADEAFVAKAQLVVNGVLADPTEGITPPSTKPSATPARANASPASRAGRPPRPSRNHPPTTAPAVLHTGRTAGAFTHHAGAQ